MRIAICPYCSGVGMVSDECKEDLLFNNQGKCTCSSCGKKFIIYYEDKKVKTKEK